MPLSKTANSTPLPFKGVPCFGGGMLSSLEQSTWKELLAAFRDLLERLIYGKIM